MTTVAPSTYASALSEARPRRSLRWLVHLPVWTILLGAAALLTLGVGIPRLTGATPYVILTSSMEPKLPPGTLVISRPVHPDKIGVGDVITYQLLSGEPEVVTHRVVSVGFTTAGEYEFITKGDANDLPDAAPVRSVQVRGKTWYAVPYVGRVTAKINPHDRRLLTWCVGGALMTQGAWWIAEGFVARRRRVPT